MTIIEKIRAEIERRFIEYNKDSNHHLQAAEDAELLSFLDTLEESEKPEPFFYCKYGGIMPKCSDCKRNHSNSKYKTEDIENWFSPSERGTKRCSEYIPLQESEKPMNQDVELNDEKWTSSKVAKPEKTGLYLITDGSHWRVLLVNNGEVMIYEDWDDGYTTDKNYLNREWWWRPLPNLPSGKTPYYYE